MNSKRELCPPHQGFFTKIPDGIKLSDQTCLDPEDGRGKAMLQQWESYEQDIKRWLYHDKLSYHAAFGKKKLLKTYGNYCL